MYLDIVFAEFPPLCHLPLPPNKCTYYICSIRKDVVDNGKKCTYHLTLMYTFFLDCGEMHIT